MTDDDDHDNADDGDFLDTLREILGAPFMVTPVIDVDLAFGAVDSHVDLDHTPHPSPLSLSPHPFASPPSSAAGEPT